MRTLHRTLCCTALLLVAACSSSADSIVPPTSPDAVRADSPREMYVVTLAGDPTAFAVLHGLRAVHTYRHALNGVAVELTPQAAAALARNDRVRTVTKSRRSKPEPTMADPSQSDPVWNLDRIDQASARLDGRYSYWPTAGAGVHAYVIDSGIRATHTDFGGRVSGGVTFVDDGNGTGDCLGHGTHVAGSLGGAAYGVAKSVALVPVRIFNCAGDAVDNTVTIAALDWIIANALRPAVVNMSLGGPVDVALDQAVENTVAAGITVAVAAGNWVGAYSCNFSPARTPSAITVGASAKFDYVQWGGGPCLDLYAPGTVIVSDWYTSDVATATLQGTSMAAPHVAGAAALYLARNPGATPAQVTSYLLATATVGALTQLPAGTANRLLRTHAAP